MTNLRSLGRLLNTKKICFGSLIQKYMMHKTEVKRIREEKHEAANESLLAILNDQEEFEANCSRQT